MGNEEIILLFSDALFLRDHYCRNCGVCYFSSQFNILTMRIRKVIPCIICGKPVKQDKSTSVDRQTCKRKKVNGVYVKSECEKEKNRRYQSDYRKNVLKKGKKKRKKYKSVAVCSGNHLAKYKAVKYKRRCLKCGKKFIGMGPYNRICDSCSVVNSRSGSLKGAN